MTARLTTTNTAARSSLLSSASPATWIANALADRDDWVARVAAAGGTVSSGTQAAVLTFVNAIYSAGIRGSFVRLNLLCGDFTASLVPLFRSTSYRGTALGNSTDTNVNFVSADYSESTGLKGNGTSKYLNTGVTTEMLPALTSAHLAVSGTSFETTATRTCLGSYDGIESSTFSMEAAIVVGTPTVTAIRLGTFTAASIASTTPNATQTHLVGSRTASNSVALYRGGSSASTSTGRVTIGSTTRPVFVFAVNNSGGPTNYTAARMTSYSIGSGLTASQVSAYSSALIAFNTALGR